MKSIKYLVLFCSLLFVACESEYSKVVKQELASGEIHEDLIFDMKLGITRKEFFAQCWTLNNQQKISQGPGNNYAKYFWDLDSMSEQSQKVEMLFYGIFDENKIMHGMDMKMSYSAWSPWNENFHSPKLMEALKKEYLKTYPGNPFMEIKIKGDKKAFVKIDGNRQIRMYALSNRNVAVKIEDLREVEFLSKSK